jgi:protein TonB
MNPTAAPHYTRRSSSLLIIAAAHAALIYVVATSSSVRQMLDPPVIQASLIDQTPQKEAPPPPPPKLEFPDPPSIEPPDIVLAEEPPAPAAITVVVNKEPAPPKVDAGPRVISDVAYLEPPRPAYPAESRRSGEQGLVVLRVLIDEAGHVARVEVQRSSGFARLDDAARKAVERAHFRPYVENGVPRQALAVVPIEFTWKSRAARS